MSTLLLATEVLCVLVLKLKAMAAKIWKTVVCSKYELKLETTLACGQSFRWREHKKGEWIGVIAGKVWILCQDDTKLYYQTFTDPSLAERNARESQSRSFKQSKAKENSHDSKLIEPSNKSVEEADILWNYFQLNVNLVELYKSWSENDSNFENVSEKFRGIRILRQDPVENLFSFICSSNNNISRITMMVEKLCQNYGEKVADVKGVAYYAFPSIKPLAQDGVEEELRALGFGYRAKYISRTAKYIMSNHSEEWLYNLRTIPYKEAKAELLKLCGVGAKVADCVCLMSLDKTEAVPVDTHVWQIAARDYMPKLKQAKSLTDKLYEEIGDCFRGLWGNYAGWAHSVLFTADLRQFKDKAQEKSPQKRKKEVSEKPKIKSGTVKKAR